MKDLDYRINNLTATQTKLIDISKYGLKIYGGQTAKIPIEYNITEKTTVFGVFRGTWRGYTGNFVNVGPRKDNFTVTSQVRIGSNIFSYNLIKKKDGLYFNTNIDYPDIYIGGGSYIALSDSL